MDRNDCLVSYFFLSFFLGDMIDNILRRRRGVWGGVCLSLQVLFFWGGGGVIVPLCRKGVLLIFYGVIEEVFIFISIFHVFFSSLPFFSVLVFFISSF